MKISVVIAVEPSTENCVICYDGGGLASVEWTYGDFVQLRILTAGICSVLLAQCWLPVVAQVNPDQQGKPTVVTTLPPRPQQPAEVKVPLLDGPLKMTDFEGMKPRAGMESKLGQVSGFIQQSPTDGAPGTENTEVWLGHTKTTLYVMFVCYDHHMNLLRSHLARRENVLTDDNVTILLDPFQDHRRGVLFQVNPMGVQADAAWSEVSGSDYSFDQVWDSEGRLTKDGWMVLLAIPFRSLRFRPVGSDWGVVFERNFPRNSETDYWPRVTASIAGTLTQEGTMRGIEGVTGSHNIQINPYVLGQNEKTLLNMDPLNPYFSQRTFEGTVGGEVKAIWKDSIVFDGTVNPDFSNIESAQPQFTVDQRYPVYFPELRPFFLENASFFTTPLTLLYTRNIIQPDYGLRVTGKISHTNVGLMLVDDREPGETVAPGDPLYGAKATFAVGRIAQDFGKNFTIGPMYTDEEFGGGWNRIGGVDFNWRPNKQWNILGQTVESSTKESNPNSAASVFPSGYSAGPASDIQVTRNGHAFNMQDEYQDVSTGFLSTMGFFQTSNIRSDHYHANYQWFPKKSVVQSYGLETNENIAYDHNGNPVYRYLSFDPFLLLPNNIVLAPLVGQNRDSVGPQNGYLLNQTHTFVEDWGGIVARGAPFSQFNFNLQATKSGNVNYYPVTGGVPFEMNQETVQLLFTMQPIRQITDDNTYLLDRDHSRLDKQLVYESQTLRTRLNYQFTRAFSARVIVEYDSTLANPLETSLLRTKEVSTQALLTWLPHPGTAIYVGYTNDIQNLDRSLCDLQPGGGCNPNNLTPPRSPLYLNDQRQFFVKASYLIRF